jgi:hypothetical protein
MAAKAQSILLAAVLACMAACASAQTIYKVVNDEGRITFSDQPPVKPVAVPRRAGKLDVNEAARRLRQARLQRKLGAEPMPGELTRGTGAPVPNYRYWRRQEKLRIVAEQALRRSQETLRVQVAAR